MSVSIKVSEENYRMLCSLSGRLRGELQRPVSINDAIGFLHRRGRLSDLAGAWNMSDKEAESFMKSLKEGWSRWKAKYA